MKILLVDDDPLVVQSCQRILEEEGFEIRTASSVARASVILTEEIFDLMITDINMPKKKRLCHNRRSKGCAAENAHSRHDRLSYHRYR